MIVDFWSVFFECCLCNAYDVIFNSLGYFDEILCSTFSIVEPGVASSDATNISCSIVRDGDFYVVNGLKWWSSGAGDPRCKFAIVMGVTNPENDRLARCFSILLLLWAMPLKCFLIFNSCTLKVASSVHDYRATEHTRCKADKTSVSLWLHG